MLFFTYLIKETDSKHIKRTLFTHTQNHTWHRKKFSIRRPTVVEHFSIKVEQKAGENH